MNQPVDIFEYQIYIYIFDRFVSLSTIDVEIYLENET